MSSLLRPRDISPLPACEAPPSLYFVVSLGVTAYVGRTNLFTVVSSPVTCNIYFLHTAPRRELLRTCRCCRPLSRRPEAPSRAPPGPSVASPSRGPPRLAARGSGGYATTSSRARARWTCCQHCVSFLENPRFLRVLPRASELVHSELPQSLFLSRYFVVLPRLIPPHRPLQGYGKAHFCSLIPWPTL